MMKRMLAFLCVLALLMGMYVVPASATENSTQTGTGNASDADRFQVGYAKVDVNPWVYSAALGMGVDLSKIDNYDNDIYVASVNVYDSKGAYTPEKIIRIPMAGYANSTERLSNGIQDDNGDGYVGLGDGLFITCTTVTDPSNNYTLFMFTSDTVAGYSNFQEDLADALTVKLGVTVNEDQVTLTGSHTHGGPDLNVLKNAQSGADETQNAMWKAYYNYVLKRAADAAFDACNNAQPATMSQGEIKSSDVQQQDGNCYQLNKIRQFVTKQKKYDEETGTWEYTGIEFVSGSNLNTFASVSSDTYQYERTSIAKADDTMYILKFAFDDQDAAPIILVNWRAHATMMTASKNLGLSSDYINSFRYTMEQADYRVAFFQGAAGNITADGYNGVATEDGVMDESESAIYYGGTLLAEVATQCLTNKMEEKTGNTIRATHVQMDMKMQTYSDGMLAAAKAYLGETDGVDGYVKGYHPYTFQWTEELGGDGKYYYINSKSHANAIKERAGKTAETAADMKISAFKLGDSVSIVTAPGEMYDRYSLDVNTVTKAMDNNQDNDWYDLKNILGDMPLVFGYTDGHHGYIGNYISYNYNDQYYDNDPLNGEYDHYPKDPQTGEIIRNVDGNYAIGLGSYEASNSLAAQGEGEKVIAKYGEMLKLLKDYETVDRYCEHCEKNETWEPLIISGEDDIESGHYYLPYDIGVEGDADTYAKTQTIIGNVCLDLNGHTLITGNRSFNCTQSETEFSLLDSSMGKGKVISYAHHPDAKASTLTDGGVVRAYNTDGAVTFNLYGGTLELRSPDNNGNYLEKGGVVSLYGIMNMYGGTIQGGKFAETIESTHTTPGCGAAIYVYSKAPEKASSSLNIFGGKIASGTLPQEVNNGDRTPRGACVYLGGGSNVTLAGDAHVDEIYLAGKTSSVTIGCNEAEFTGTATLNTEKVASASGQKIGTVAVGEVPFGLTCTSENHMVTADVNNNLKVYSGNYVARIGGYGYATITDAITAYNNQPYIQLLADVSDVDLGTKTVNLDLNGHNITKVEGTGKLYCMDSETDDYDATNDGGYGKITGSISAPVEGMPVGTIPTNNYDEYPSGMLDGYLKVTEGNGISFHRVNLQLSSIHLCTDDTAEQINPSVYYESAFAADEVVAQLMQTKTDPEKYAFGVALSVKTNEPTNDNMNTDWEQSSFNGSRFDAGKNDNQTSTLLKGIMKETNPKLINQRNANLEVHGCAYILINGEYMFGKVESRNLQKVMAGIHDEVTEYDGTNDIWHTLGEADQKFIVEVYTTYRSIMEKWDKLENIRAAFQKQEDETLKVLVVGNSHSLDSTHLLHEVFEKEAPDQKVVIGVLYHSGCSIHFHNQYMQNRETAYTYYKNGDYFGANMDRTWYTKSNATADVGLTDEQWDIVIMQQTSREAAWDDGYKAATINSVIKYIEKKVDNPNLKLAWNMVWSSPDDERYFTYGSGYTYSDSGSVTSWKNVHDTRFPGEDGVYDQSVMYNGMVTCTQTHIENDTAFLGKDYYKGVIPSGTAVEYLQDVCGMDQLNVYRDYTHLSDYSRLMVAYLWYAKLMQIYTGADQPTEFDSTAGMVNEIPALLQKSSKTKYPEDGKFDATMLENIRSAVNWALKNSYTLPQPAQ